MNNQPRQRPVGYSNSTVQFANLSEEIEITAYLWGGGGAAGNGALSGDGSLRYGGNGTGGGYASVTFTAGPTDNIWISVGGGGTAGGLGGNSYVLGSTSFSGATGGSGAGGGSGGGSGGATVLYKNGTLLAVAGGGGGGGGASISSNGQDSPGSVGQAMPGIFAGQNGQSRNSAFLGGGGGGAGGGGSTGGNGALLSSGAVSGNSGMFGGSIGEIIAVPNGVDPGQANNPLRGSSGKGGSTTPGSLQGENGNPGLAIFVFNYIPGTSIYVDGVWQPIKKTWIKVNGIWVDVKSTYIRIDGQWIETKNGISPGFATVPGAWGYAPRPIEDQSAPSISYSLIPDTFDPVEGTILGFTVTTTNFGTGTLYWAMLDPVNINQLASPTLFVSQRYGTVPIINDLGRFSVNISSTATGTSKQSVTFRANLSVDGVSAPASGFATGTTVADAGPITIQPTLSPPSVISVSWNPVSIQVFGSATLSWSTTNAIKTDISIPGGNPSVLTDRPASGSATVSFSNSGTFTATVTATSSLGGTDSKTAAISVAPQPQILGSFTGPTFISQTGQDQVNLSVLGPDSGPYSYVVTGSPAVTFDTSSGNPPSGTFTYPSGATRASLNLVTPHAQTVLTATISRPGYQSYTQSLTVPSRAAPKGFVEFTQAGTIGTWSVPPGVTAIRVTVVGAGGGGATGSEDDPYQSGGGGGGSGGILQTTLSVSPGDEISYQVGRGGSGAISPGAGGRPGVSGTASNAGYRGTFYVATGGAGGGASGGNLGGSHYNAGGAGGTPRGTDGSPGQWRQKQSSPRNLMPGGAGGSANPYGFGGAGAPGQQSGQQRSPAVEDGQPGTGYGAGGGGGAGGRNDGKQGDGGNGSGGYVRFEWG